MNTIKIGIVGIGNMGSCHASTLRDCKVAGFVLQAVCDISPAKRNWAKEQLPGVRVYESYHDLLADATVDAIIIATPHYLHPLIAVEAFEKGKHVLTEKPAGVRVRDVLQMNEAALKSKKAYCIMFNQRTNPLFAKAREIVHGGVIGKIKRTNWIVTNWYRPQGYYDSGDWRATWAGEGGGVLLNQAPHNLDLWQWIYEMPVSITSHLDVAKYHHIEVEDDVTIFATYQNGATGTFITSTGEEPGTNRLELIGDLGKIVIEDGKLRLWQLQQNEREFCMLPGNLVENIPYDYSEYQPQTVVEEHITILRNFADHLLHGRELLSPGEDGQCELSLSNAAYLSSWTGKTVKLPLTIEEMTEFDRLLGERIASSSYRGKIAQGENDGIYKKRWLEHWN